MSIASQGTDLIRIGNAVAPRRSGFMRTRRLRCADEAARYVARRLHRAVRAVGGARPSRPSRQPRRPSMRQRGRRRRGRPQYVVRRRYRRRHVPRRDAAHSARPHIATRGSCIRPHARSGFRSYDELCSQRCCGGIARLHDFLLRRRLHDMAQAPNLSEHRHWRRCRRLSSGDRLGCDDRRRRDRAAHPVPHHLPLDAASLLGAVAQSRS